MESILLFLKTNWAEVTLVFLAFHAFIKAIRDAIDKTPETDDNAFERAVTIIGKTANYLMTGKRA